jgi:hypothetical protein
VENGNNGEIIITYISSTIFPGKNVGIGEVVGFFGSFRNVYPPGSQIRFDGLVSRVE